MHDVLLIVASWLVYLLSGLVVILTVVVLPLGGGS